MKNINYIFIPLFLSYLLGLTSSTSSTTYLPLAMHNDTSAALPVVQEMIDLVDKDRILQDLRRLTGVEPICTSHGCTTITGRETGTQNLQWAKDYVYETLINLHYTVEVQNWTLNGLSDQNILAHKRGFLYPNEEIYFIAHLDGYLAQNPAADDDATGSVALLELARILANQNLKRSVTIFFSTGEEHGARGAKSFVNSYPERLANIKYLISSEMLGYDSNNDGVMELWSGDTNTEFQQMLKDIIGAYPITLTPRIYDGCT